MFVIEVVMSCQLIGYRLKLIINNFYGEHFWFVYIIKLIFIELTVI